MTIALSLLIRPSRHLQMVVHGFCVVILTGVFAVLTGVSGNFSVSVKMFIASVAFLSVALALVAFYRNQKTWRMHISPEGVIRLREAANPLHLDDASNVFHLLPDSTLWSSVMLLHLKSDARECVSLPILPDSVGPHEFRMLSVALRWIAARGVSDERGLQA